MDKKLGETILNLGVEIMNSKRLYRGNLVTWYKFAFVVCSTSVSSFFSKFWFYLQTDLSNVEARLWGVGSKFYCMTLNIS